MLRMCQCRDQINMIPPFEGFDGDLARFQNLVSRHKMGQKSQDKSIPLRFRSRPHPRERASKQLETQSSRHQ